MGILVAAIVFGIVCLEGYIFMSLYNYAVIDGILKGGTMFKKIDTIWKGICLYLLINCFFNTPIYNAMYIEISDKIVTVRKPGQTRSSPFSRW